MVSAYKFSILLFLLFQSFLRSFSSLFGNDIILKQILFDKYKGPQENGEYLDGPGKDEPKEKIYPFDKDDIFKEYEYLLDKEKVLKQKYDSEYMNLIEKENQLKIDKTYITLLIIISFLLSIIIIIHTSYEIYKCKRNKKKLNLYKESFNKMKSFGNELKSSLESSKSNEELNRNNSSFNQSQNIDLNISSNYNIIVKDSIKENIKKEENNIEPRPYNDGDEAPIQLYENNINNNIFNDDMKTLTNDENVYFASKTDKLLYKPYSKEEINNK